MRSSRIYLPIVLLTAAALALPAWSDEPARPGIRETVDVDVVNIPVVVTDSAGNPVTGLSASDFILLEDGKKKKITNFSVVALDDPEVEDVKVAVEGSAGSTTATRPSDDDLLSVALYVDDLNINPIHRNHVFKKIRDYLENEVKADTPIMLVSMGGQLKIHQPFTWDRDVLMAKMSELETSLEGRVYDFSSRDGMEDNIHSYIEEIISCRRSGLCGGEIIQNLIRMTVAEVRAYSQAVGWQSEASLNGLQTLCRSLALTPGNKVILYISDGFSMEPGKSLLMELRDKLDRALAETIDASASDAVNALNQSGNTSNQDQRMLRIVDSALSDAMSLNLPQVVEEAGAMAASDNIRIYSILAKQISSGVVGADVPSDRATHSLDFSASPNTMEDWHDRTPLDLMADATGGQTLQGSIKTERLLGQIRKDHRNHYSLGFRSDNVKDGEFHEIKVKLKAKGVKGRVRHPHGYLAKTDEMHRADQVLGAVVLGDAGNPHEVAIELGAGEKGEDEQEVVPVRVLIPVRHMALLEEGSVHATDMTLGLAVVNDRGKVSTLREYPVQVRIPSQHIEAARSQSFPVKLNVTFPMGKNTLAVGVWDANSSLASFMNVAYNNQE